MESSLIITDFIHESIKMDSCFISIAMQKNPLHIFKRPEEIFCHSFFFASPAFFALQ